MAPYFNPVYDKRRRGLRVWFQVTAMYPLQGYIIGYSALLLTFLRLNRRSPDEDPDITALPHNMNLVSKYVDGDDPPEYFQDFTDDDLREMNMDDLGYELANAANE